MVRQLTAAALALVTVSCAPDTQKPTKVRALVLSSSGQYQPKEVELKTVTNIVTLEGDVVRMQGGATIRVDPNDPELQAATTEEAFKLALTKEAGRPVTANYLADEQGVLWPADFHTWNLVTTYYNLERAADYFKAVGGSTPADLAQATVYYFPEFTLLEADDKPQRDNALFFSPVKSFMVLPFETIQSAPLAINASVLTHEYAHLIFNRRVYGGRALPPPLTTWAGSSFTPGLNVIKTLDEGLADFHAWAASCRSDFGCNPRLLFTSFGDQTVSERDLSKSWCMSQELYNAFTTSSVSVSSGLEYKVGTILASALVKSSTTTANRDALSRAIIDAYTDTANSATPGLAQLATANLNSQDSFTLAVAVKAIVRHIDPSNTDLRYAVCSNLANALQIPVSELTGNNDFDCPASTVSTGTCRPIETGP